MVDGPGFLNWSDEPTKHRCAYAPLMWLTSSHCWNSKPLSQKPNFLRKRWNMCWWAYLFWRKSIGASKTFLPLKKTSSPLQPTSPIGASKVDESITVGGYWNPMWPFSEESTSAFPPTSVLSEFGEGQVFLPKRHLKARMMSLFGSTYVCKQTLSLTAPSKSPLWSKRTDGHLCRVLCIATTFSWLVSHSTAQGATSHHLWNDARLLFDVLTTPVT